MALDATHRGGELKINGVSMVTPAWRVKDYWRLWFDPPLRGQYVTIPGADGQLVVPMRSDVGHWSLEFVIVGDVDQTGSAYAASGGYSGPTIGMASNLNYLRTNVLTGPSLTGNRTRAATLKVPGEVGTRAADIHCWLVPGEVKPQYMMATLEISIPAGSFV